MCGLILLQAKLSNTEHSCTRELLRCLLLAEGMYIVLPDTSELVEALERREVCEEASKVLTADADTVRDRALGGSGPFLSLAPELFISLNPSPPPLLRPSLDLGLCISIYVVGRLYRFASDCGCMRGMTGDGSDPLGGQMWDMVHMGGLCVEWTWCTWVDCAWTGCGAHGWIVRGLGVVHMGGLCVDWVWCTWVDWILWRRTAT